MKGFKCKCSKREKYGCMGLKDPCFCLEKFFMHALIKEQRKVKETSCISSHRTCALDTQLTVGIMEKVVRETMEMNLINIGLARPC